MVSAIRGRLFQVVPGDGTEKYAIAGLHDADQSWMRDVRSAGHESGVRILPRVMFERFSADEYLAILQVCYSSLRRLRNSTPLRYLK